MPTLTIKAETKRALDEVRRSGESYDEVIRRLVRATRRRQRRNMGRIVTRTSRGREPVMDPAIGGRTPESPPPTSPDHLPAPGL